MELQPKDYFNIFIYSVVLLAIIGHILLVLLIGKIYNKVNGSLMKADLCRIRETEGDTVRYEVMNAIQDFEKNRKVIRWILRASLIGIVAIFILLWGLIGFEVLPRTETPFLFVLNVFILSIVVTIFIITDIILLKQIPNDKIKNENNKYIQAKDKIVDALKKIDTKYKLFKNQKNEYPDSVKNLYNLILERRAFRSNDNTIEESKNALAILSENEQYEQIFTYLKLDATFKDQELLKQACKDSGCAKLNSALNLLQTYHPNNIYKDFFKFIKTKLITVFVLLAFYSFPLFHIFYNFFGAVSVGIATILLAFCMILLMYKQF